MKTSRIEFGSGILMSEGSHGFNGMLWRRCQRGCSLNSSRSWIESGLELFRMGRAFLGGVWCPGDGWGLQHPQSQQGELRSGGMGASSSKRGWSTHSWDGWDPKAGHEPKAGHLCDSQMGLWLTFPTELQPAQGEFRKTHSTTVALPSQPAWSSSGSACLEALPL